MNKKTFDEIGTKSAKSLAQRLILTSDLADPSWFNVFNDPTNGNPPRM